MQSMRGFSLHYIFTASFPQCQDCVFDKIGISNPLCRAKRLTVSEAMVRKETLTEEIAPCTSQFNSKTCYNAFGFPSIKALNIPTRMSCPA